VITPSIERTLQEYLDGRLTPEEVSAFEQLIERDPEIAIRVRAARGVRRALRDEIPELSPDFFARARRRFETGRERRPLVVHLLSWEAAGLGVAAIVALALFVPWFLQEPARIAERATNGSGADAQKPPPADMPAGEPPRLDAPGAPPPAEVRLKEAVPARPAHDAIAKEVFAPSPAPTAVEPEGSAPGDVAPATEVEQRAVGESAAPRALSAESSVAGARERDVNRPSARRGSTRVGASASPVPAGAPLPAGVVAAGEVVVLGSDASHAWRVVLIGAREGITDCTSYEIHSTEHGWDVRYHPERAADDGGDNAATGCSIGVPDDGRPVRVVEAP
jgi:hypothetical protein